MYSTTHAAGPSQGWMRLSPTTTGIMISTMMYIGRMSK